MKPHTPETLTVAGFITAEMLTVLVKPKDRTLPILSL